ncbi:hypothetical protein ACFL42_01480 [Candidatus Omnitrophota bacterium]
MSIKGFILSWGMLLFGVLMNVFGVYIVKMRINEVGSFQFSSAGAVINYFITLAKSPIAVIGAVVIMAAPLPYAIALSKMELSVAYPASVALNCLLVLFLATLFLGESITWNKAAGIGMIMASLYLLYGK